MGKLNLDAEHGLFLTLDAEGPATHLGCQHQQGVDPRGDVRLERKALGGFVLVGADTHALTFVHLLKFDNIRIVVKHEVVVIEFGRTGPFGAIKSVPVLFEIGFGSLVGTDC